MSSDDQITQRLETWGALTAPIPKLPHVRGQRANDHPDYWIVCHGQPLSSTGVPRQISEAQSVLEAQSSKELAVGPVLTESGWVGLINPQNDSNQGATAYRRAAAALARRSRNLPLRQVIVGVEGVSQVLTGALVEGFCLGWYQYPKAELKSAPELLVPESNGSHLEAAINGELFSNASCLARMWTEEAPNRLTPEQFAQMAARLGRARDLQVEVFAPDELRKMGMGGVLAVGDGSKNGPYVVVLRYRPDQEPEFGLVGKGITFDSGGISLKPAENLRKLKGDKAGAAAVLAAALMATESGAARPFVAVLPFAENLPSHTAFRPGDVITMLDGTTVDVVTTDAEGRMVLADGLTLARTYGCRKLVTLATLTKACIIALGNFRGALFATDDALAQDLVAAGDSVGEPLWRMPLDAEYAYALRSSVADLQNSGEGPGGGAIVAAKFIEHFAHASPFAHIDMSSLFFLDSEMSWGDKGYTGAGARLLLALLLKA